MKFLNVVVGATAVSALSLTDLVQRASTKLVDLTPFLQNSFPLLSPEKAAAQASAATPTEKPLPIATDAPVKPGAPQSKLTASTCTNPAIRWEWRGFTNEHKAQYISSVQCLFRAPSRGQRGARNRFEDLVSVHQQKNPIIHGVGQFLPWHRYMLHVYEQMLRQECGYTGPIPWWDETRDAGNFHNSPMFTNAYFGAAPLKTSSGQGTCLYNGAFAQFQAHIGPGSSYTTHCISRAVDEGLSSAITSSFVNTCASHPNYVDMQSCSFFGPHAYGHNAVGAVMSDVMASPSDPIFYLHHGFIDHNWRIWQNADPANRRYQIGGYTLQGNQGPLTTLDYVLDSLGIRPATTIRNVMDTEGGYLCYRYDY